MNKLFFPNDHKSSHVPSLDGLRGIAILIVLFAHGSDFGLNIHPFLDFHIFGRTGVYLFFILSAYLLDRQIIHYLHSGKVNLHYWANYILRRVLRIYPLFAISLVVYYVLNRKYLGTFIKDVGNINHHLLLNEGMAFYWSIPIELKYYLVSPILLLIFSKIFKWKLRLVWAIILFLIIGAAVWSNYRGLHFHSLLTTLPVFLTGTFFALYEKFEPTRFVKLKFEKLSIVAVLLLFASVPFYWGLLIGFEPQVHLVPYIMPYTFLLGVLFLSARNGKGLIRKIVENKILRFFGTVSFSLYLFHWAVILFVKKYGVNVVWLNTLIYFSISTFVATCSYLLIEHPLSKIRIKKKSQKTPATVKV